MLQFEYDPAKDQKLRSERSINFDEIILLISDGFVLDVLDHPNQERYPGQKIYALDVDGYVWLVPFMHIEGKIFLKTAFPSRKLTKKYLEKKHDQ